MKRYTETEKWNDKWFRKLPPISKLLWIYMIDTCNVAGVIDLDFESASYHIGAEITQEHVDSLGDRIRLIEGTASKFFIKKFISFQYKKLSADCPSQIKLLELLTSYSNSETTKFITQLYPVPKAKVSLQERLSNSLKARLMGKKMPPMHKGRNESQSPDGQPEIGLVLEGQAPPAPTPEEVIYEEYPKKVGKPDALKAIKRALKRCPFEKLMERTKKFCLVIRDSGKDMKYVPNPATWFNQDRFNDNIEDNTDTRVETIECTYGLKNPEQGTIVPTTVKVDIRFLANGDIDFDSIPKEPQDLHIAVQERLVALGLW